MNPPTVDTITKKTNVLSCRNCGLEHAPRSCPAYHDECNACGSLGHWKTCCMKSSNGHQSSRGRGITRGRSSRNYNSRLRVHDRRGQNNRHKSQDKINFNDSGESDYDNNKCFYSLQISDLALSPSGTDEVLAQVYVSSSRQKCKRPTKNKSGGNTLSIRTYKQMCGNIPTNESICP